MHSYLGGFLNTAARFLNLILCSCFAFSLYGQGSYPVLTNVDSAEIWFDKIVGSKSQAIMNGPSYRIAFKGFKTHPFYYSSESENSFVLYNNDLYRNINLLYDSYADLLVLKSKNSNGTFFISLDQNLVQAFDLHGHHFKKYEEGVRAGIGAYFDVIFEKEQYAIVIKRRKLERIEGTTRDYLEDDVYYILDKGLWTRITGKGSFKKSLNKLQGRELDTFIKSNGIQIKRRKEDDLKKLGAFCYSLTKQR